MEGDAGTAAGRDRPGSSLARAGTAFIIIHIFPGKTKIGLPREKIIIIKKKIKKKKRKNFHREVSRSEMACPCGKAAHGAGSGAGAGAGEQRGFAGRDSPHRRFQRGTIPGSGTPSLGQRCRLRAVRGCGAVRAVRAVRAVV